MKHLAWLLFSWHGRIGRQSFWLVILSLLALHGVVQGLTPVTDQGLASSTLTSSELLLTLLSLWIQLAAQIKRWHDLDKSGWWSLIGLVPVVGPLWILLECGGMSGTQGENRFGAAPTETGRIRLSGLTNAS